MRKYQFLRDLVPLQIKDRYSIFIIICVCAGLPALVWSARDLIHHRKNGHRISAFIILLLLTDCVEIFLSPVILLKLFLNELHLIGHGTFRVFVSLWFSSRHCGLVLNQLVALEGILSVKYPLHTASVFSSPFLISFYILVFLCIIIGGILLLELYFLVDLSLFIISVITWIISSFALCCADRHSHTSRKPDRHIWVVFIFTLLVLLLPNVFLFFNRSFLPLHVRHIPHFLLSVRLISDPLVCVLVCRQNLSVQTSQPDRTSLV
ncbi:hypothetical protein PO909_006389 [Leuciscus waleckii]